jgi:hypothetical protein
MENTEQKTPEQWFQQLKEPYRSEAINNLSKKMSCYIEFPDSLIQALNCSFQFADSNEGNNYWWEILRSIKAGETTYLETEPAEYKEILKSIDLSVFNKIKSTETELKPQDMNNEKRIPFDWDKYQSGEYEAVCRNGDKPEMITYNPNAKNFKIGAWVDNELERFLLDGSYQLNRSQSAIDLFLIPKAKKFQAWVNLYDNGNITYHLIESESESYKFTLAIKGIKCVETRLIEWEG